MLSKGTPIIPHFLDFTKSTESSDWLPLSNPYRSNDSAEKANFPGSKVLKSILDESLKEENIDLVKITEGETNRLTSQIIEKIIKKEKEVGIEKVLEDAYLKIVNYIRTYKEFPKYSNKRHFQTEIIKEESIYSTKLYLLNKVLSKLFDIYGYTEKINELLIEIRQQEIELLLDKMIEFMKNNNNNLPSIKSEDKKEISLALAYNKLKGKLSKKQQK